MVNFATVLHIISCLIFTCSLVQWQTSFWKNFVPCMYECTHTHISLVFIKYCCAVISQPIMYITILVLMCYCHNRKINCPCSLWAIPSPLIVRTSIVISVAVTTSAEFCPFFPSNLLILEAESFRSYSF